MTDSISTWDISKTERELLAAYDENSETDLSKVLKSIPFYSMNYLVENMEFSQFFVRFHLELNYVVTLLG